jgi:putative transposase
MSRKCDRWDNAPMESINGTSKVECVNDTHFTTSEQAWLAIVEFIRYYSTEIDLLLMRGWRGTSWARFP